MKSADLRELIERMAGLSLSALRESLPNIAARRSGPEWMDRFRAAQATFEGEPEAFWAETLIRFAEGDRAFLHSQEFCLAYAEAQNKRGAALYKAGKRESHAAKAYFRAAKAYEALGRAKDARKALKNRGGILAIAGLNQGRLDYLDQAIRSYESCLAATNETAEPVLWAELQADLGYALRSKGLIDNDRASLLKAARAFEHAARLTDNNGASAALWSRAKNSLGATLSKIGELDSDPAPIVKAIAAYHDALSARPIAELPNQWLNSWTNIMQAEFLLAKLTRDAKRLRRAHDGFLVRLKEAQDVKFAREQTGHTYRQLAANAQLLGEMERAPDDLRAALSFYDRALASFSALGMPYAAAQMHAHRAVAEFRLGTIASDPGIIAKALTAHLQTEDRFSRRDQPYLWAHWHQTHGTMCKTLARFGQSAQHLQKARASFERALEEYRREIYPQQWAETTASLCQTLLRIAVTPEDWRHLSNVADDLIETVHSLALIGLNRAQQRSLLRTLQGIGDLSALAHIRLGEPHRAFEALTTARAVGSDLAFRLASGKRDDNALPDSEPFRRWQSLQIAVERQLRDSLNQAGKSQPVAAERLEELRAAYQELMTSLKASGALERERMDVPAFAQTLSTASAAAVIFASENGGGILIVTPGATAIPASAAIELPQLTSGRLEALLNGEGKQKGGWLAAYDRYRTQSSSWDEAVVERAVATWNSEIESLLPQLWDLVMSPLAAWLEREAPDVDAVHLMVPGLMSMLPLHAARPAQSEAPYFAERWAVSYLPSPRALMTRPALGRHRERSLLAITDPAGDIGADVNPAWPFFAAPHRRTVQGRAPDVAAALAGAGDVSHVSFFCHGIWEGSDPDFSHLVMADGSQLSAQDLAAIDLRHVDLALLGACETALIGTRGTPDEFTGLPVALLQAGVRCVAASQWLVDAASTYALLHRMMQEHRAGLSPARALQAAQRAFVAGEMDTIEEWPGGSAVLSRLRTLRPLSAPGVDAKGHAGSRTDQSLPPRSAPFFWAAFAVIGRG
ncbi:MAG: hypothetical protein C0519_01490 [Hyphomicrobium sp.]|nr:hypothetical protein [Hyphomicrobium sp.]PPD09532.1 MAG: hypothetical protein CTY28_01615 [Hyphomicrobium sp.]